MNLTLFNSLTRKKEAFKTLKPNQVSMYTCGPTVYNYAHIGNFFAYLTADTLYRWLKFGEKYEVKWVLNITDVEDKTIRDSKINYPNLEPMQALKQHCDFYLAAFEKDLELLNIKKQHFWANPRVTEYIEAQKELVCKIYANGFAYISDGSVYFSIEKYKQKHKYGKLVNIDIGFKDGVRVDSDEYDKESAADFVLWKGQKEGEPAWDFALDNQNLIGRPGWHLECSAMEYEILNLPFDIHTGGMDLKFPHHEDEIAQSVAGYGLEPNYYWLHNGYLQVEGEKMSKSKNNFFRLADLVEKQNISPEIIRFMMVTNHYRKDFNFTQNGIHAAQKNLQDIQEVYTIIQDNLVNNQGEILADQFKTSFNQSMRNDLNTPEALAVLLKASKYIKKNKNNLKPINLADFKIFFDEVSQIFGVSFAFIKTEIPIDIIKLAEARQVAKKNANFLEADKIREQIEAQGFLIKDQRDGFEVTEKF